MELNRLKVVLVERKRTGKWLAEKLEKNEAEIDSFDGQIPDFKNKSFYKEKDIENLLSYIILFEKVNESKRDDIEKLRKALESKIKDACTLTLDTNAPHLPPTSETPKLSRKHD